METIPQQRNVDQYAKCIEVSKRVRWDIDNDVLRGRSFRLEVCMFAANLLGVKPETIAPEIHQVGNGWIASLGYQQQGYAVIPAY